MPVTYDELSKLLTDQNEQHAQQWQERLAEQNARNAAQWQEKLAEQNEYNAKQLQQQLNTLAKTLGKAQPSAPSGANNIKYQSFSGDGNSDVNSFIRELNLTGAYQHMDNFQKAKLLPLLLT